MVHTADSVPGDRLVVFFVLQDSKGEDMVFVLDHAITSINVSARLEYSACPIQFRSQRFAVHSTLSPSAFAE